MAFGLLPGSKANAVIKNLKYPKMARAENKSGIVEITFKVNERGEAADVRARADIGYGFASAAIEAVSTLKGFEPNQKFEGREYLTLPIAFSLSRSKLEKLLWSYYENQEH